jgi:pyruvate dehydrogenase E1 component alpha subunit
MLQILTPEGELVGDPPIDIPMTRKLYRAMVASRLYDRKATAIQKQGRLATYAPFEGQEAAQVGSAAALRPDDWMVATYRDAAAMWMQGYPWELLFAGRTGHERGGSPPDYVNVLPPSITVGAHMLHAVGLSWAERLQGNDRIAITYFGDGATSEGDFHEALNFAAIYRTGTVFLCQNNHYAISTSLEGQMATETIAQKAGAYGIPGVRVDGNDLLAVYWGTKTAIERARGGNGPTLIEAVTYRLGPHTTSDDPARYRSSEEVESWRGRDPLERVRRYLEMNGAWDEEWQKHIEGEEGIVVERAVDLAESLAAPDADELFDSMFAEPTHDLENQRRMLESEGG